MVKIECVGKKIEDVKDKGVVIGFFEDKLSLGKASKLDGKVNGAISKAIKNKDFKGEEGEIRSLYVNTDVKYVVLLGLGKEKEFNSKKLMNSLGSAARSVRGNGIDSFSIHFESFKGMDFALSLEKMCHSLLLSLYQFTKYKTRDLEKIKKVSKASIVVEVKDLAKANKMVKDALIKSEAVVKTRDLVNTPPNVAVPEYVADYAKEVAKNNGLKCTIFDEKQLEKLGMECYVAVGKASVNKPRMVILEYNGGKGKPIVLVGKGITYDTGGINTKPAEYMVNMKDDKAGACSVINILVACAKLKLKVNVVGIAALAENAVSGNAYKPDDVLKSYSGITVEVIHSDAEGRMVLADALAYSLKYDPRAIVDIATLTGASIVALGYLASPVLGNDDKLIARLKEAGEISLDRVWELPIWEEHNEIIKSDVADVKHLSGAMDAGVIIGGVFLKQFVKEVPWAHIDIGATVWSKQDKGYKVKGATGFGVLLLLDFLKKWK